jgi:hypothetical protein
VAKQYANSAGLTANAQAAYLGTKQKHILKSVKSKKEMTVNEKKSCVTQDPRRQEHAVQAFANTHILSAC